MKILEPDFVWRDGRFRSGEQVEVDGDGVISRVGPGLGQASERLSGEALLPAMVNAHSHAFQRGLRGKAELYGSGSNTFWSWREEMYRLANALDEASFHRVVVSTFREMLDAGIASVGEFHYLHHLGSTEDHALDAVLVGAASEVGIRLTLLDVYYATGDIGRPLGPEQARFGSRSLEDFLDSTERLASTLDARTQSLGLVAHSVRAVPLPEIVALHERARASGLVFHMHVEEQGREIHAAVEQYGARPLALLLDHLEVGAEFTAVHCTHSNPEELSRLLTAGANVCLCPLTEANLADGIPPVKLAEHIDRLSLGTDSNLRIDFNEEMRLLEYAQRLGIEKRGVFRGSTGSVAAELFRIATEGGARALGARAGRIEEGYAADLFTLDLNTPALDGVDADELMSAFVFGASQSAIGRIAVAGEWRSHSR